jgi:hypothetical protein
MLGVKMKNWHVWSGLSIAALIAAAYCFLNFWAAVDLGYDAYPGGKSIIATWCYAFLGLACCFLVFAVVAGRLWWQKRRLSGGQ